MPAGSPSEILATLKSGHTPAEYLKILEKHVYPALDRLPAKEKTALVKALSKTSDDHKDAELVNFDGMQMSLSKQQKALAKSVRSDWKTGWQEQGEMMSQIDGDISGWLPTLWKVGVEHGKEHRLVHKSLKLCKSTYDALRKTNSQTDFEDLDGPDITIEDATGKTVYFHESLPGSTMHAIIWLWRELLLSSIVRSDNDTLAKSLVVDIGKNSRLKAAILERLDEEIAPPPPRVNWPRAKRDFDAEERHDLLMNAHWTPEMLAAVPRVQAILADGNA
ncbi:hypothetical protein PLICRDRAFT_326053 [Plicaturopsis crispa FD-325 SS-3]|nr:hypothetical protein PLICRDRAFT_326053 [Plicaturopsis crispa FD-325 SS-3]